MRPLDPKAKPTTTPSRRPTQQSFDFTAPPGPAAPPRPKRSPGPSRWRYRLSRIWKKTWVRRGVMVGLPSAIALGLTVRAAIDPAVHAWASQTRTLIVASLSERPEFAIHGLRISNASPALALEIDDIMALPAGASTLTFDVAAAQAKVGALPAVRSAHVTLAPDGMLDVEIEERHPRALWRDANDQLWLIDEEGVALAPVRMRGTHPELPLVLGEDADRAVAGALALLAAAPDLRPRIRAFVRVGQRRWNVALDHGMTIMLPEDGAADALARVMAWHYGEKVLESDLSHIDMRLPERPTLRMTPRAVKRRPVEEQIKTGGGQRT